MKKKALLFLCAILAIEASSFSIMAQNNNLLAKDDQWWQQFITAQSAAQESPHTQNNNLLVKDDQWWQQFINAQQEPQESWYSKVKKRIDQLRETYKPGTIVGIVASSFISGFLLRDYLLKIKFFWSDRKKLLALNRQQRNLKEAVDASDVSTVKNILGDLYNDEIHRQLAANKSKDEGMVAYCPICVNIVTNPRDYRVGSPGCFHFECAQCYNKWQNTNVVDYNPYSGRDSGGRRPCYLCRK